MSGHHASPPRGLEAARSPLFQGRFGRIFRNLAPANYGASPDENLENLAALAAAMEAPSEDPEDGPDPEESGIPALYTYFGQFVDHDITFDPVSMLTKAADPDGLTDFRTPALDLDNVYGRGPGDQPYMYDPTDATGRKLQLGEVLTGDGVADAHDLPRFNHRALIGDPRNDENSIVSQLQGLFHRFHNRMCDDNPDVDLAGIQRLVRFHYQYVILNDFLPRIVSANVLKQLRAEDDRFDSRKLRFYHWHGLPFMPVEFAVAAYRIGHSMIRPDYRLNDAGAKPLPIFPTKNHPEGLTGFQTMRKGRAIDWGRFIDVDVRAYDGNEAAKKKRLQFAYRIDTSLVGPLTKLPPEVASDKPPALALRNLERAWRLGLPSGQAVARAMGVVPLKNDEIIIGKATDDIDPKDAKTKRTPILDAVGKAAPWFDGNCPLWTYILAEAVHHGTPVSIPATGHDNPVQTPQLGPVGGRIVAEVFLGMMFGDGASMLSLDPMWVPMAGKVRKVDFKLKDIVTYALGIGPTMRYTAD